MSYDIGYRRPPKTAQFKKGQSGNPKGRPKGALNFITVLEHELSQKITVNENGKKAKVTRLEAMVKRLVMSALQGDQKSVLNLVEILRRTGKVSPAEEDDLLPPDHEQILAAYVQAHQKSSSSSQS